MDEQKQNLTAPEQPEREEIPLCWDWSTGSLTPESLVEWNRRKAQHNTEHQ